MNRLLRLAPVAVLIAAGAVTSTGLASSSAARGAPPPEFAEFASQWPAHNLDLSNTRSTTASPIDSSNVSKLAAKWRFKLTGAAMSRRGAIRRTGCPPGRLTAPGSRSRPTGTATGSCTS